MPPESSEQQRSTAIEQLKAFGLSTYAARTFVALVSLGDGTAQDVSEVSEVPRTRVYDATEELRENGLVHVQQTTPKRFAPVSTETTGRHFRQDYVHRVHVLTDALDDLGPVSRSVEQPGVWTVTGRDTITDRVVDFIESASDEVVYMTVEDLLVEECIDALRAAADNDVTIRLAGTSPAVTAELEQLLPAVEHFESIWEWSDLPAGRVLMVDEEKTLASVIVEGDREHPPESRDETAIWGTGDTNNLVVVLKALFTWQLEGARDE